VKCNALGGDNGDTPKETRNCARYASSSDGEELVRSTEAGPVYDRGSDKPFYEEAILSPRKKEREDYKTKCPWCKELAGLLPRRSVEPKITENLHQQENCLWLWSSF